MVGLAPLIACAGHWTGSNRLHDPHSGSPEDSNATVTIAPVLDNRFVRLDYTWGYHGKPQEGSFLVGYDPNLDVVSAVWIDSWHNSHAMMLCAGTVQADGSVSVRGSYPAPPGPNWEWRSTITPSSDDLAMTMHNISPDGKEEVAVEARYARPD